MRKSTCCNWQSFESLYTNPWQCVHSSLCLDLAADQGNRAVNYYIPKALFPLSTCVGTDTRRQKAARNIRLYWLFHLPRSFTALHMWIRAKRVTASLLLLMLTGQSLFQPVGFSSCVSGRNYPHFLVLFVIYSKSIDIPGEAKIDGIEWTRALDRARYRVMLCFRVAGYLWSPFAQWMIIPFISFYTPFFSHTAPDHSIVMHLLSVLMNPVPRIRNSGLIALRKYPTFVPCTIIEYTLKNKFNNTDYASFKFQPQNWDKKSRSLTETFNWNIFRCFS